MLTELLPMFLPLGHVALQIWGATTIQVKGGGIHHEAVKGVCKGGSEAPQPSDAPQLHGGLTHHADTVSHDAQAAVRPDARARHHLQSK